jgi:hypothetical protein
VHIGGPWSRWQKGVIVIVYVQRQKRDVNEKEWTEVPYQRDEQLNVKTAKNENI